MFVAIGKWALVYDGKLTAMGNTRRWEITYFIDSIYLAK
jgi:hypothetical protein